MNIVLAWNLPREHPMVAPGYSERRSSLAKQIGLGRGVGHPAKNPRRSHLRYRQRHTPISAARKAPIGGDIDLTQPFQNTHPISTNHRCFLRAYWKHAQISRATAHRKPSKRLGMSERPKLGLTAELYRTSNNACREWGAREIRLRYLPKPSLNRWIS